MAISIRLAGTWADSNATTQTVTLPTHVAGDMLILRTIRKPFTNPNDTVCNTTGWTAVATGIANGATANGVGVGSMGFKAFYKIATSASETSPVVTWGTTSAPGAAVAISYQKGSTEAWIAPVGNGGGDATARTSMTATIASTIAVTTGDMVDFFIGCCDDNTLTVPTITQTGVTYGTVSEQPAAALSSGTSNDISADGGYRLASSGTASAAAVVTGTSSGSDQHGAWMTRMRVIPTVTGTFTANAIIKKTQTFPVAPGLTYNQYNNSATFGSNDVHGLASDGTNWVGGSQATTNPLGTATDPATTSWGSPSTDPFTEAIESIGYGNGVWVAISVSQLATATTSTGTWTLRTAPDTFMNGIAYGNGVWVVVTGDGQIYTATDPTSTWTPRTSPFGGSLIWDVKYGNGLWVAVANSGKLATASDPTGTWTLSTALSGGAWGATAAVCVEYGSGVWVVGGDERVAWTTSPTGSWTMNTPSEMAGTAQYPLGISYGNGSWAIFMADQDFASGTSWVYHSWNPSGTWTRLKTNAEQQHRSRFANGQFVIGLDGAIAVATFSGVSGLTADAQFRGTVASSLTANAAITGIFGWVDPPADTVTMDDTPVLTFRSPVAPEPITFQIQLDTSGAFNTGNLLTYGMTDGTWEYYNGSTWVSLPSTGLTSANVGSLCRFTVPSPLTETTWYRRIRYSRR